MMGEDFHKDGILLPAVGGEENNNSEMEDENNNNNDFGKHSTLLLKLLMDGKIVVKNKNIEVDVYKHVKKLIIFIVHFVVVMILLFSSAVVFATLEDPEQPLNNVSYQHNLTEILSKHVNISLTTSQVESILHIVERHSEKEKNIKYNEETRNRKFIFYKWFYFATIATTTIGYGDVTPKTTNGRIFYIFFSILGIILMLTWLKSCAELLNTFINRVNMFINRFLFCRKKVLDEDKESNCESDEKTIQLEEKSVQVELLTVITLIITFILYLCFGVYRQHQMEGKASWELIDHIYYLIVTFTTVGFGDMTHDINEEMKYIYELIIYRSFGLVFVAGIIESTYEYLKARNKLKILKTAKYLLKSGTTPLALIMKKIKTETQL